MSLPPPTLNPTSLHLQCPTRHPRRCGSDLTIPRFSEGRQERSSSVHGVTAEWRSESTGGAQDIIGLHGIQSHVSKSPLRTFGTTVPLPWVRSVSLQSLLLLQWMRLSLTSQANSMPVNLASSLVPAQPTHVQCVPSHN